MKRILCLLTVFALLMVSMVTVSAASVAKFNLTLVSETDTQAVVTFDFEGGTSFSALDFDVVVNEEKVKVTNIENGEGLVNFQKQGTALAMANPDTIPAKVSLAMIPGYRNVDGKALFKITLKKLTKETLTSSDVEVKVTNCADNNYAPIQASVTTDVGNTSAQAETIPQEEITSMPTGVVVPEEEVQNTVADGGADTGDTIGAVTDKTDDGKEEGNNSTTIIIIAVVAVVVVGGAVAVVVLKKKKPADKTEKTEDKAEKED